MTTTLTNNGRNTIAQVIADSISYLEVGCGSADPAATQTTTQEPKIRVPVTASTASSGVITVTGFLGAIQGVCNASTILSVTSNQVFTLQSGEGALFEAGQLIRVNDAENGVISAMAGDQVTLVDALSFTPAVSQSVRQLLAEATAWGGDGATSSIGTGTMYGRVTLDTPFYKASGDGANIEFEITVTI